MTEKKKQISGNLLPDTFVGDGVLDVPQNVLTRYGKIADKYISQMSHFYDNISVDNYVIMPNHIHLLIQIVENDIPNGTSRTPSPTNSMIAKFISTFKRFCNKEYGQNIWQRLSHDHIIRGDVDYLKIWEYIDNNPATEKNNCFYNQKGRCKRIVLL